VPEDHQYVYGRDGANKWHHEEWLTVRLCKDDVEDASFMKVKAIVTKAKSYDVLVGAMVL
jgi:hypothetical protein